MSESFWHFFYYLALKYCSKLCYRVKGVNDVAIKITATFQDGTTVTKNIGVSAKAQISSGDDNIPDIMDCLEICGIRNFIQKSVDKVRRL